jgi:hypothetical protein
VLRVELELAPAPVFGLGAHENLPPHLDGLLEGAELDVEDLQVVDALGVVARRVDGSKLLVGKTIAQNRWL